MSRTGTAVPMWPMVRIRAVTPGPSCGASRIPAAISSRTTAARLVNPPLATSTASTTASVYVIAAAMWAVSGCRPKRSSSRAYCGTSVV